MELLLDVRKEVINEEQAGVWERSSQGMSKMEMTG